MNKKYHCYICGAKPCTFSVNDSQKKPFACPFDKKHDADWKEVKKQDFADFVGEAKMKFQMISPESKEKPDSVHVDAV